MAKDIVGNEKIDGSLKTVVAWVLGAVLAAGAVVGVYVWQQQKINDLDHKVTELHNTIDALKAQNNPVPPASTRNTYTSAKGVKINVYTPEANAKVSSPVVILGEVPGNWSFEASFPVVLKDSQGAVVAQGTAQLLGDWMTDQLVPFTAKLTYPSAASGSGTLTLQKDNPSGEPNNDDSISIPITF